MSALVSIARQDRSTHSRANVKYPRGPRRLEDIRRSPVYEVLVKFVEQATEWFANTSRHRSYSDPLVASEVLRKKSESSALLSCLIKGAEQERSLSFRAFRDLGHSFFVSLALSVDGTLTAVHNQSITTRFMEFAFLGSDQRSMSRRSSYSLVMVGWNTTQTGAWQ